MFNKTGSIAKAGHPWAKPKIFDTNLLVIGAGSGGLVASYIAAAVKAKVSLIEQHKMGGDCLNTGCVPSKALIRSTRLLAQLNRSAEFGIKTIKAEYNFADIMERVQRIVNTVAPHDSIERYKRLGVDVLEGKARLISPWEVEVITDTGIETITTLAIVIAAGARPFVPSIPGLEKINYLTSDNIWNLREKPQRMVVLGGDQLAASWRNVFPDWAFRSPRLKWPRVY